MFKYTKSQIYNNDTFYIFSPHHQSHISVSLELFKSNYILGIGPKMFRIACKEYDYNDSCSTHPHNYLFEIASDAGIIGIVLFMMFAFSFAVYFFKKNKLILLYGFIFYFPFLPSGSFYASWDNMIFWFTLSILFMFKNYYNENARKLS